MTAFRHFGLGSVAWERHFWRLCLQAALRDRREGRSWPVRTEG